MHGYRESDPAVISLVSAGSVALCRWFTLPSSFVSISHGASTNGHHRRPVKINYTFCEGSRTLSVTGQPG
jgi:hypothetical protein